MNLRANSRFDFFKEVLADNSNRNLYHTLTRFNQTENFSVDRPTRTLSPFQKNKHSKPPLPKSVDRYSLREQFKRKNKRPKPSYFDFGPNCFYMTEKIDDFKWDDITNKQLAEKVRMSILEVDQVLQINNFAQTQRSQSACPKISKPQSFLKKDEDNFRTPSPKGSFHKFREFLKSNNLVSSFQKNE